MWGDSITYGIKKFHSYHLLIWCFFFGVKLPLSLGNFLLGGLVKIHKLCISLIGLIALSQADTRNVVCERKQVNLNSNQVINIKMTRVHDPLGPRYEMRGIHLVKFKRNLWHALPYNDMPKISFSRMIDNLFHRYRRA